MRIPKSVLLFGHMSIWQSPEEGPFSLSSPNTESEACSGQGMSLGA